MGLWNCVMGRNVWKLCLAMICLGEFCNLVDLSG